MKTLTNTKIQVSITDIIGLVTQDELDLAIKNLKKLNEIIEEPEVNRQINVNISSYNNYKKKEIKNIASETERPRIADNLLEVCTNIQTWLNTATQAKTIEEETKEDSHITPTSKQNWRLTLFLLLGGTMLGFTIGNGIYLPNKGGEIEIITEKDDRIDSLFIKVRNLNQDNRKKDKTIDSLENLLIQESTTTYIWDRDPKTINLKKRWEDSRIEAAKLNDTIENIKNQHIILLAKIETLTPRFKDFTVTFDINSSLNQIEIDQMRKNLEKEGMVILTGKGGPVKRRINYYADSKNKAAVDYILSELQKIGISGIEVYEKNEAEYNTKIYVQI